MARKQRFTSCDGSYLLVIALVSILSFLLTSFNAEGRMVPNHDTSSTIEEEKRLMGVIGSRPPTCEMKCGSSYGHCLRCVAVQVPARPAATGPLGNRDNDNKRKKEEEDVSSSNAYGRGYDDTPYKPLSWKCKCQGYSFNP